MNGLIELEVECVDAQMQEMGMQTDGFFLPATINLDYIVMIKKCRDEPLIAHVYTTTDEVWGVNIPYEQLLTIWKTYKNSKK